MKINRVYISILLISASTCARAADDLPKRLDFDRYKGMLEHSPFAVATAIVAPAATPNFAKDMYVANAAKAPGCDMVTIGSTTDRDFKKYLTTCGGPVDGYAISNIEWSEKVGETKVTISKDGQFATLTFNQSVLSQPLPNKPAPGVGPPPAPAPPGVQKPIPTPATAVPTPHVRGVIPRNPQPSVAAPPSPPATQIPRRQPDVNDDDL
jgi:hypothetical protein